MEIKIKFALCNMQNIPLFISALYVAWFIFSMFLYEICHIYKNDSEK